MSQLEKEGGREGEIAALLPPEVASGRWSDTDGKRGKATRRRRGGRGHQVKSFQLATAAAAAADDAGRARPIKLRGGEINGLSNRRRRRARIARSSVWERVGSMSQSHRKWITGQHEVHFVPFVYAT